MSYTQWGLKKQLEKIASVASDKIVSENSDLPFIISREILDEVLGRKMARHDEIQKDSFPGATTRLAWIPMTPILINSIVIPAECNGKPYNKYYNELS